MDKCPHCSGTSGYRSRVMIEYQKQTSWAGFFYLVRNKVVKEHKRRYCMDCGKCVSALLDAPTFKL